MITMPLPSTRFYLHMAAGHRIRTGHALNAHLASKDGGGVIWYVVRDCCEKESDERA